MVPLCPNSPQLPPKRFRSYLSRILVFSLIFSFIPTPFNAVHSVVPLADRRFFQRFPWPPQRVFTLVDSKGGPHALDIGPTSGQPIPTRGITYTHAPYHVALVYRVSRDARGFWGMNPMDTCALEGIRPYKHRYPFSVGPPPPPGTPPDTLPPYRPNTPA